MSDCPDSEKLVAYTIGLLERDDFIVVLKHVAECGSCRRATLALVDVLHEFAARHKSEESAEVP